MVRRASTVLFGLLLASCASGYRRPKPGTLAASITFGGTFDSTWGRMVVHQQGKHVHGTFTGYREGGLSGDLEGDVWHFVWDQRVPRQHGHGFLQASPDGIHLEGRWGYDQDDLRGGRWAADRDTTE